LCLPARHIDNVGSQFVVLNCIMANPTKFVASMSFTQWC